MLNIDDTVTTTMLYEILLHQFMAAVAQVDFGISEQLFSGKTVLHLAEVNRIVVFIDQKMTELRQQQKVVSAKLEP